MSKMKEFSCSRVVYTIGPDQLGKPANVNISREVIADCVRRNTEANKNGTIPRSQSSFWQNFAGEHVAAAEKIYRGFVLTYGAHLPRTQSYQLVPGKGAPVLTRASDLEELFAIWARAAANEKILIGTVLDIIVFGKSCRKADQEASKRKGFAKQNLVDALELYLMVAKKYTKMEKIY